MENEFTTTEANELFTTVSNLKTPAEARDFLRDILTLSELENAVERFQVAKMVDQKIPYREISKQTGASTATVTRVAHWVHHGMGGYRRALE